MEEPAATVIEMEKAALERWGKGDPGGFLDITARDIAYFDPYIGTRIDGLESLEAYYRQIWGTVLVDRFELLNPRVQASGELVVLTFNYVSYKGEEPDRWNCTEVYRRGGKNGWEIIQTHWSYTEVFKNKMKE